jgi:RNA polymerase sigma factor (sigma-70 family)
LAADPAGRATRIERDAAPEADATRDLYERYASQIFGYCVHRLGSREEAEDAVQSTFLNAFRALGRGVVPESESAWLFKIAENVCHSRHRSSWRRGRVESPSDLDAFQDVLPAPVQAHEDLIPLAEALERLPENQRRAILLREWQGLSYREIAQELQLSQSAIETLIFRARRSLVEGLEAPPAQRRGLAFRRATHGIDAGWVVGLLKALFAGGAAVKAAAVAVAVTGATVGVRHHHVVHHAAPAPKPLAKAYVARRVDRPAVAHVAPAPVVRAPAQRRAKPRAAPRVVAVSRRTAPSRGPVGPGPAPAPAPKPPRELTADPPPQPAPPPPPPTLEQESPGVVPASKGRPSSPPPPAHATTSSPPATDVPALTQTVTVTGG